MTHRVLNHTEYILIALQLASNSNKLIALSVVALSG
jgi:hypothetical protein